MIGIQDVDTASHPQAALSIVQHSRYDIVIVEDSRAYDGLMSFLHPNERIRALLVVTVIAVGSRRRSTWADKMDAVLVRSHTLPSVLCMLLDIYSGPSSKKAKIVPLMLTRKSATKRQSA